jgi:hypothetical protein
LVEVCLKRHGVLVEDHRVYIESERHARVAQLDDSVGGVESSSHADLDHVRAEGAEVGDHVDVARADVRCALLDAVDGGAQLRELRLSGGVRLGI